MPHRKHEKREQGYFLIGAEVIKPEDVGKVDAIKKNNQIRKQAIAADFENYQAHIIKTGKKNQKCYGVTDYQVVFEEMDKKKIKFGTERFKRMLPDRGKKIQELPDI